MKCNKVRHRTLSDAVGALKNQPLRNLRPYRCKKCDCWHLATDKRNNHYFQDFIDRVIERDKKKSKKDLL